MSHPTDYIEYCNKNNITPRAEVVVCAANRFPDGTIICGARHWDKVMRNVFDKLGIDDKKCEQGFINQWGVFLTREEAMNIVSSNGQPFDSERNGSPHRLFSEGLY